MKKARIEIDKEIELLKIRQPETERKFQHDERIAGIKQAADMSTKAYLEDRKDERTAKQATQQSKLKKQAQTDGQPIDFENEQDWMITEN